MLQNFSSQREDGSTASEHDANGDGIFNIEDYETTLGLIGRVVRMMMIYWILQI